MEELTERRSESELGVGFEENLDHEQEKDRIGNNSQKGRDEDSGDSFKELERKGTYFP